MEQPPSQKVNGGWHVFAAYPTLFPPVLTIQGRESM